jgi:hypothetical protein
LAFLSKEKSAQIVRISDNPIVGEQQLPDFFLQLFPA